MPRQNIQSRKASKTHLSYPKHINIQVVTTHADPIRKSTHFPYQYTPPLAMLPSVHFYKEGMYIFTQHSSPKHNLLITRFSSTLQTSPRLQNKNNPMSTIGILQRKDCSPYQPLHTCTYLVSWKPTSSRSQPNVLYKQHFTWPSLCTQIENFVKHCNACQHCKAP